MTNIEENRLLWTISEGDNNGNSLMEQNSLFQKKTHNMARYLYTLKIILLPLIFMSLHLQAMDSPSGMVVPKMEGTLRFDGMPDDAVWQNIPSFQMVTHSPVFGLEPTEKTDIKVTYDQDYIYIGASFYAKDASLIRLTGDEYLKLVWAQNYATGLDNDPFSIKNVQYFINWERRKNVGFYYDFMLTGREPQYQPGIGHRSRDNYYYGGATINYSWMMGEDSPIINHGPCFRVSNFISQTRGLFESVNSEIFYEMNLKNSWFLSAGLSNNYEHIFDLQNL